MGNLCYKSRESEINSEENSSTTASASEHPESLSSNNQNLSGNETLIHDPTSEHSQSTDSDNDISQHSNEHELCQVLKKQKFEKSDAPRLHERLIPDQGSNKFGKIQKSLNCLMGNGRDLVLTIPEIVEELLPRNYPELTQFNGNEKLVVFVPEWYLTKAVKYVEPTRGLDLQEYSTRTAETQTCPERKKYFEDMKKFHMGGKRTYGGELPERTLYDVLQERFKNKNESVAVFHGIDILKLNLDRTFKVSEKDFVIISFTYRYVMVIEVKKTLGAGDSVAKSTKQLIEAKEDLEAWFGTEGLHNWMYIPVIFAENITIPLNCHSCNEFIITGTKLLIL